MSGKVSGWAWDQELPQNLKFVLLCYADHADHDGNNIYPSADLIGKKTGYTKRTVKLLTRKLEDLGLMIPVGSKKGGRSKTNRWMMPISGGQKGVSGNTHSSLKGVTQDHKRVLPSAQKGVTAITPEPSLTVKEPSNSRPNDRKRTEKDRIRKHGEEVFAKLTGLDPPTPTNEKRRREAGELWWNPLRQICEMVNWDKKRAGGIITEAVTRLRSNDLTISSPKSILQTCTAIMGEIKTGEYKPRS